MWRRLGLSLFMSILILTIPADGKDGPDFRNHNDIRTRWDQPALRFCDSLSPDDRAHYFQRLAKQHRLDILKVLAASTRRYAPEAATTVASIQTGREFVAFCESFSPGSSQWKVLFPRLRHGRKADVIAYITKVARSPDPAIRCQCYEVCKGQWAEVAPQALRDCWSTAPFGRFNGFTVESVGAIARSYLDSIGQTVPDADRQDTHNRVNGR
jgi:hypothetical protein